MFKIGDRVVIRLGVPVESLLIAIRDKRLSGVVEDIFEDGLIQVRFVDGSPHDAVHFVSPEELELA